MLARIWKFIKIIIAILAAGLILSRSDQLLSDPVEEVRRYTRSIEFDYVNWTLESLFVKNEIAALGLSRYIDDTEGSEIVTSYFEQVDEINELSSEISSIYADPNIADPQATAANKNSQLDNLKQENKRLAALCEMILQQQVASVIGQMDLSLGGQLIPPLLYHVTPLPMALIISPRDVIRQDADISLLADLSLDEVVALESQIEKDLDVSALVVNIGGVGIYPTMVLQTTNLSWMIETIAHEWTHNYLTLRPVGMLYENTPQLRTMNETTASLAGEEIALEVYKRFYPQFVPQEIVAAPSSSTSATTSEPVFDYNAEMHETRVIVDQMLLDGKIEEAEKYMENRRLFFRENGYLIRRLNQAYFAFHSAYADVAVGSAGEDPVGPAVRKFREQSNSLAQFLNRISWMTSFESLQETVSAGE